MDNKKLPNEMNFLGRLLSLSLSAIAAILITKKLNEKYPEGIYNGIKKTPEFKGFKFYVVFMIALILVLLFIQIFTGSLVKM